MWIPIDQQLPTPGENVEIKGYSIADEVPIITSGALLTKEGYKIQKQFTPTHWRRLSDINLVCKICGCKVRRVGKYLVHFPDDKNHTPTFF